MKYVKLGLLITAAFLAGTITLLIGGYLYISSDSWGASDWRAKLAHELGRRGEVGVSELVEFRWDKIFLVGPYDLAEDRRLSTEIWGYETSLWWATDERYWTVIYRRIGAAPFLVKVDRSQWKFVGRRFSTTEQRAKLVLVDQRRPEHVNCPRQIRYCMILE